MPSFDVVSEVNKHEFANAVDQASREVATRFDFKGTSASIEYQENTLTLHGDTEFQLKQILDIVHGKLAKRGVDVQSLKADAPVTSGSKAQQKITLKEGIEVETAKKIVKLLKESGLKVQASIQGDQVRVSGKKRDDLQDVIALLRKTSLDLPLQYINFRD